MDCYDSIGAMIKWYIKCRNKTIKETAASMNIKETTFSAQLINNTVTADTLLRLAAYLDIDLEWMMIVLGYHGPVSPVEREMIPRMRDEFRTKERKRVNKVLDCKRQVLFPKKRHLFFLKCGKLFSRVCGILFSRVYVALY